MNDGLRTRPSSPGSPPSGPGRGPAPSRRGSGRPRRGGLIALPTSWAVTISTTLTRPSSMSTSTTARWAAKEYCTCALPCPVSGSSGWVGRCRHVDGASIGPSPSRSTRSVARSPAAGRRQAEASAAAALGAARANSPSRTRGAGGLHRAAGHIGLPGRRRRAGAAHRGVGGLDDHLLDAQFGAGDLGLDGHQPLADLGRRRVHRGDGSPPASPSSPGPSSSRRSPRRTRRS